jgi:hypothetical protein
VINNLLNLLHNIANNNMIQQNIIIITCTNYNNFINTKCNFFLLWRSYRHTKGNLIIGAHVNLRIPKTQKLFFNYILTNLKYYQ